MKLSDLRPCDGCGGPLFTPPGRWFQVLRISGALLGPRAVETLRAAVRQGVPLSRLEAEHQYDAVLVLGDDDPRQREELLLCVECYHSKPVADIVRRRRQVVEGMVARGES